MRNAHLASIVVMSILALAPAALAVGPDDPVTEDLRISLIRKNLGAPGTRQLNKDRRSFYWEFGNPAGTKCTMSLHTQEIVSDFESAYPYEYGNTRAGLNEYEIDPRHPDSRYQRHVEFKMQTADGSSLYIGCQKYGATPPAPFTLNEVRNLIGRNRAQIMITTGTLASRDMSTGETAVASGGPADANRGTRSGATHGDAAREERSARPPQAAI